MQYLGYLISMIISWGLSGLDIKGLKEDLRKAGLILFGAGFIGLVVSNDNLSILEAAMLIVSGCIIWVIGLKE